jgi:hypothetical protein
MEHIWQKEFRPAWDKETDCDGHRKGIESPKIAFTHGEVAVEALSILDRSVARPYLNIDVKNSSGYDSKHQTYDDGETCNHEGISERMPTMVSERVGIASTKAHEEHAGENAKYSK